MRRRRKNVQHNRRGDGGVRTWKSEVHLCFQGHCILDMERPVQIVSVSHDHKIDLHEEALERILLADSVKDKPVIVVSVMGPAHGGKSFLLNYLLRYLNSSGGDDWIGDDDAPLSGFNSRNAIGTVTKGILLWNKAFSVRTADGDEAALLLMDTEGAFGMGSSSNETASLSALSVLASSLQIYNVRNTIQEDQLQRLQLVAEFGKALQKSENSKPFQKLAYVVRDWQSPGLAPYGPDGGRQVLDGYMNAPDQTMEDENHLRQSIHSFFSAIDCFLMPYPGKVVCSNTFDGRLRELDEDFKHSLKDLVPWLLAKEKLEVKKIYGNKVTCQQLLNNFKKYATIIREGGLPKVKSEVEALADETNRSALEKAKEFYIKGMQEKTYATLNEVKENHVKLLPQAKEQFLNSPTIDYYVSKRYLKILRKEIVEFARTFAHKKYQEFLASYNAGVMGTAISAAVALPAAAVSLARIRRRRRRRR
uniref:Guanylate-binding protein n=1 Tax=Rhipicephalus zambeziensis TaxID=60191 RepID=A0A224Z046_9ACAR